MTDQRPALGHRPQATARIVHAAIMVGVLVVFGVFLFLRARMDPLAAGLATPILKWVGLGILAIAALVSYTIRARIPGPTANISREQWWADHFGTALVSWAVAEGGGLAAIILGWLAENSTVMAAGAAVALALLFVTRPGALEGAV
ncbi:MAG: hypothetical protein GWN99_18135 [Gemmatimonadetes bacterium]|uniref:Uncharacterized protein n=1 Tax=Candidatus Kutchimonas denitrificans TaxID=3056748 RepID=A0AAE5C7X9_9BACT|nr:hypothetical protein [Gemmatimonadota bacterium]NIR73966.1 hypothetical protein [Candidatus Kutchimonas denitrificans]NIS02955.1 hypothetical protein [Gemmatimonadota bacterium]NIT68672.1 hypothetical protein [Gemmatimonadota bacterium]NIU53253.1 hypothetical protein [Gemmatimonadota bacterium]